MDRKDLSSSEWREPRRVWRWLAGTIAVVVTLAILGGLVYQRLSARPINNQPIGSASVSGVNFNCRLPVLTVGAAGFISFPSGAVTIDRRVTVDPYKGEFAYTYDAQIARWVPVPGPAMSPDGQSYAYLAQTTGVPGQMMSTSLHTHEIASGKDRLLWEAPGSPMGPGTVAWLRGGIYFSAAMGAVGGPETVVLPAVYVSDPNHQGAPRRVGPNPPPQPPSAGQPDYSGSTAFTFFGGGAAWGVDIRAPKQAPPPNSPPAPGDYGPNRVLRLDLNDGSVSTWYEASDTEFVSVVALDGQGRPILALLQPSLKTEPQAGVTTPPVAQLQLLTGPNTTIDITSGNVNFHFGSMPSSDSHGIWFGSWDSVWLYSQNLGLRQVATIPTGVFPSPSLPPGVQGKGAPPSGAPPMPSYMQGTLVTPAGSCT